MSDLILIRERQVFDLHLPPSAAREEKLLDTCPVIAVHHRDGSPISAHPDQVSPDGETSTSSVGVVIR